MIFILAWLFLTCVTSRPGRDVSGLEVEEEKTSKFPVGVAAEANSGVSPKLPNFTLLYEAGGLMGLFPSLQNGEALQRLRG